MSNINKYVIKMYSDYEPFPYLLKRFFNEKNYFLLKYFSFLIKKKFYNKENQIASISFLNTDCLVKKKLKILDLGCGTGEETCYIANYFSNAQVLGVDASDKSLYYANKLKNFLLIKNCKFKKINIEKKTLAGLGKFDLIIVSGVLHHLKNPKKELKKVSLILKDKKSILVLKIYNIHGRYLEKNTRDFIINFFPNNKNLSSRIKFLIESKLERDNQKFGYPKGTKKDFFFQVVRRVFDFVLSLGLSEYMKNLNSQRFDAFLNPNVHYYDSKKIKKLLNGINLKITNFYFDKFYSKEYFLLIDKILYKKNIFTKLKFFEKVLFPKMTNLVLMLKR